MNIYIFQGIDQGLTDDYHSGGGAVVVAASLEDAIKMLPEECEMEVRTDLNSIFNVEYELLADVPARAFIFPDAGCC